MSTLVPPLPPDLNRTHLAVELATEIHPKADICARYGVTEQQVDLLLERDLQFRGAVEAYAREWGAPMNTRQRLKLKAEIAAEDGLPTLYAIFKDPAMPPPSRLEAFKQISQIADVLPKKDEGGGGGGRFVFTLNLGDTPADRVTFSASLANGSSAALSGAAALAGTPAGEDGFEALEGVSVALLGDPVTHLDGLGLLEVDPLPIEQWPDLLERADAYENAEILFVAP